MRIIATMSALLVAGLLAACGAQDDSTGSSSDLAKPGTGTCGNGSIESGEQCDGRNLNGATCSSLTGGEQPVGTVTCTRRCKYDIRRCSPESGGGAGG